MGRGKEDEKHAQFGGEIDELLKGSIALLQSLQISMKFLV